MNNARILLFCIAVAEQFLLMLSLTSVLFSETVSQSPTPEEMTSLIISGVSYLLRKDVFLFIFYFSRFPSWVYANSAFLKDSSTVFAVLEVFWLIRAVSDGLRVTKKIVTYCILPLVKCFQRNEFSVVSSWRQRSKKTLKDVENGVRAVLGIFSNLLWCTSDSTSAESTSNADNSSLDIFNFIPEDDRWCPALGWVLALYRRHRVRVPFGFWSV